MSQHSVHSVNHTNLKIKILRNKKKKKFFNRFEHFLMIARKVFFFLVMAYLRIIYPLHGLKELMVVAGYGIRVFLKHTKQGASLEEKDMRCLT